MYLSGRIKNWISGIGFEAWTSGAVWLVVHYLLKPQDTFGLHGNSVETGRCSMVRSRQTHLSGSLDSRSGTSRCIFDSPSDPKNFQHRHRVPRGSR
jgi:hypothetical protein